MVIAFVYLNVLLYTTFGYMYFFAVRLTSFKPLYWIVLSIVVGLIINFHRYGVSLPAPRLKRLLIWVIPFFTLSVLSFIVVSDGSAASLQVLINYLKGGSMLIVFSLLLRERYLAFHAAYALVVAVILSVIINGIDFFQLSSLPLSDVQGRAAGMYINSNMSGKMLVLSMLISVYCLPKKFRFIFCLFTFIGVLLTFSRSSIMIWFLVILFLSWQQAFVLPRVMSFSIVLGGSLFLVSLLVSGALVGVLSSAGVELNKNTTARMGGSFLEQEDFSSKGRAYVAEKGIDLFLNNPILGRGIGLSSNPKYHLGTHNSYIQLAAEQGIFGLLIFLSLIWMVWLAGTYEAKLFAVGFSAFSLFTHNMIDQPAMYLLIVIAVSGVSLEPEKAVIKQKKVFRE